MSKSSVGQTEVFWFIQPAHLKRRCFKKGGRVLGTILTGFKSELRKSKADWDGRQALGKATAIKDS